MVCNKTCNVQNTNFNIIKKRINISKLTSQILQIEDPAHGYLVNRNRVKVHVEWLQSFLLFQSSYHHYDDLIRIQTYQMR